MAPVEGAGPSNELVLAGHPGAMLRFGRGGGEHDQGGRGDGNAAKLVPVS